MGDIRIAQALKIVMGQGFLAVAGLHCSTGEPEDLVCEKQSATLVIMSGGEGPDDDAENKFLQGLLPLSSSTPTTTPRDHARCGLQGDRIGEAAHPGPNLEKYPLIVDTRRCFAGSASEAGDREKSRQPEDAHSACCNDGVHVYAGGTVSTDMSLASNAQTSTTRSLV